jgi:large subunit ribosomal protein L30
MSDATPQATDTGTVRVTLVRSTIGRPKDQVASVRCLKLRRMHQTSELPDTPSVRGMIYKVRHLVEVEEPNE